MRLFVLCALLISFACFSNAETEYGFRHLSKDNGISHDQINNIYQDSEGFMWFSTAWGLNRYDGYRSKQFHTVKNDSTSIKSNFVSWVRDIADNKLYIHTDIGDCIYDKESDTFSQDVSKYEPSARNGGALLTYVDQHHNVWVADGRDLYVSINSETKLIMVNPSVPIESNITGIDENNHQMLFATENGQIGVVDLTNFDVTLRGNIVSVVTKSILAKGRNKPFIDNDGEFWFVNRDALGIWRYNPKANKWAFYNDAPQSVYHIPSFLVKGLAQDHNGIIWVATDHAGAILLDKKNLTTTELRHDEFDSRSITNDALNNVFCDYNGTMWIGYYQSGLSYYNPSNFKFGINRLTQLKNLGNDFVSNITTITEDGKGHVWLGTNGSGLVFFDMHDWRNCKIYRHDPNDPNSLRSDVIVTLEMGKDGNLWIGTYLGGLSVFDGKNFTNYLNKPGVPAAVASQNIWAIRQGNNDLMWIGSLTTGLASYDLKTKVFTEYNKEKNHLLSDYISALHPVSNSNSMYVSCERGISILSPGTTNLNIRTLDGEEQFPMLHGHVHDMLEDSRGLLWVGTRAGLCVYNPSANTCKEFNLQTVAGNDYISAIVEDDMHNIWATTADGLCCIKVIPAPTQEPPYRFEQYKYAKDDGLEDGTYNIRSMHKLPNGNIIIGRSFGLSHFTPNDLHINQEPPQVHFTLLRLFDEEAKPLKTQYEAMPLKKQLYFSQEGIELPSSVSMFTVEFSTLNYILTQKTTYSYRLEGMSKNVITTNIPEAHFTNLLPGKYTLYVTATNADGYTNNHEYSLPIRILPPWYASPWAFVIYTIIFVILVWCGIQMALFFMQSRYEKHSKFDQEIRNSIFQKQNEQFISRISDEFGTPLSEIEKSISKIRENSAPESNNEEYITIIENNTHTLQKTINHFMNLNIVAPNQRQLKPQRLDIVSHVRQIYKSFENKESHDIEYTFYSSQPNIIMDFDPEKITTALSQIISNASKYTPDYGQISVSIEAKPESISIIITDSGIGISKKYRLNIFEKFYQAPLSEGKNPGYGMGLYVASELIKLHNGSIEVNDNPNGAGTQFTIVLPYVQNGTEISQSAEANISSDSSEASDLNFVENARKQVLANLQNDYSGEDMARNLNMSRVQLYKKITTYTGKTPVEYIRMVRLQYAADMLSKGKTQIFDVAKASGFNNMEYFQQYFKAEFGVTPEEYRQGKRAQG